MYGSDDFPKSTNDSRAFFSSWKNQSHNHDKTALQKGKQKSVDEKAANYVYDCNVCSYHLTSITDRLEHVKEKHPNYPKVCEKCGCAFKSETALARHQSHLVFCIGKLNKRSGVKVKDWAGKRERAKNSGLVEPSAEDLSEDEEEKDDQN